MKIIIKASNQLFTGALLFLLSIQSISCKKLVEANAPITGVSSANVYNSDATAIAEVTGVYTKIMSSNFPGGAINSITYYGGLSADELTLFSGATDAASILYYTNNLSNTQGFDFWNICYPAIFSINAAVEGLNSSVGLTPAIRQQLLGEAKFMRGFYYFYLANLYGDVPLVLSTDYTSNAVLARNPQAQVYQQVIKDLIDAQSLLSKNFLDGSLVKTTADRLRPTMWAATALLSRVYLYMGDYVDAEAQASTVIANSPTFGLGTLLTAFAKNGNESIWQLQPVRAGINTPDANLFVLPAAGPNVTYPVYLSAGLVNSFELNDGRKTSWTSSVMAGTTKYYYAYKFKAVQSTSIQEYETVLRLGELLLIRAEARAQQGNTGGSAADLNLIRARANLSGTAAATKSDLLTAIQNERRVELFAEWGHRWLDIKRTGSVDAVMNAAATVKNITWVSSRQLFPVPLKEITADPNLTQNQGY